MFILTVLSWCSHGSHKAKYSDWCDLGILWGHHGMWPCLIEGKFRSIYLPNILQDLLIWLSGQVQIWKATCLSHPKSLKNTSLITICSSLSTPQFPTFQRFGDVPNFSLESARSRRAWNDCRSHPNQTYDKSALLAFLGPDPVPGVPEENLDWDNNESIASTCWAGMVVGGRLRSPKEDFVSLFIV